MMTSRPSGTKPTAVVAALLVAFLASFLAPTYFVACLEQDGCVAFEVSSDGSSCRGGDFDPGRGGEVGQAHSDHSHDRGGGFGDAGDHCVRCVDIPFRGPAEFFVSAEASRPVPLPGWATAVSSTARIVPDAAAESGVRRPSATARDSGTFGVRPFLASVRLLI